MGINAETGMIYRKHITPKLGVIGEKCLFTISVGVSKQNIDDLVSAYLWAKKQYNIKAILLGDGLYRITLNICKGFSTLQAKQQSIEVSDALIKQFKDGISDHNILIYKTSDIMLWSEYEKAYEIIDNLYFRHLKFQESIISSAVKYAERQSKNGTLFGSLSGAVELSIYYMLQELTIYLIMAEKGWLTEIYLGDEIPALALIMKQEIPEAPQALKNRVNIGLQKKLK